MIFRKMVWFSCARFLRWQRAQDITFVITQGGDVGPWGGRWYMVVQVLEGHAEMCLVATVERVRVVGMSGVILTSGATSGRR
jgi:hypothetical protein